MSNSFEVEFVEGPLDGIKLVHDTKDYILLIEDEPSGFYQYEPDLRYHWIPKQFDLL